MSKSTLTLLFYLKKKQNYFRKKFGNKKFFFQINRIAKEVKMNRRTVIRQIKTLEMLKILIVQRSTVGWKRKNYYHINTGAMADFIISKNVTTKSTSTSIKNKKKSFPSEKIVAETATRLSPAQRRQKLKRSSRSWTKYILKHWNSKGKPLTVHNNGGTRLYSKIDLQVRRALKNYSRKDICTRIDKYFWLLTKTDLQHRIPFHPPGLVVNLAEFFSFTTETKQRTGFTFNHDSWFEECGNTGLVYKYSQGNEKLAKTIGKEVLLATGFKATIPELMRSSKLFSNTVSKYKLQKGVSPVQVFVNTVREAGMSSTKILRMPFLYENFSKKLSQRSVKKTRHMFIRLERSWDREEAPTIETHRQRMIDNEKKKTKTSTSR